MPIELATRHADADEPLLMDSPDVLELDVLVEVVPDVVDVKVEDAVLEGLVLIQRGVM